MRRTFLVSRALILCCVLLLAAGCATSQKEPAVARPEGKLGVAGFSNPIYNWEMLAGYLDVEGQPVPKGTLKELNKVLIDTLGRHQVYDYVPPATVRQCEDVLVFEESGTPRISAWKYWLGVAKCMQLDYLLVPQVTYWRERVGSDAGVTTPASVTLELYLINVKQERMTRARYEETQQSLMENLFTAKKFASRGGRWVTALRLASDGLDVKLTELGL